MNDFDKTYKQHLEELWGKVGFIVNLSQMIEYNLANILAFDEILRGFDNADSMYLFEYNIFVSKALAPEFESPDSGVFFPVIKSIILGILNPITINNKIIKFEIIKDFLFIISFIVNFATINKSLIFKHLPFL